MYSHIVSDWWIGGPILWDDLISSAQSVRVVSTVYNLESVSITYSLLESTTFNLIFTVKNILFSAYLSQLLTKFMGPLSKIFVYFMCLCFKKIGQKTNFLNCPNVDIVLYTYSTHTHIHIYCAYIHSAYILHQETKMIFNTCMHAQKHIITTSNISNKIWPVSIY